MAEEKKLNLYQKITAITESLGIVQKDANAPKEMGGFRFLSHGTLLGHLRHELTKHNVVIIPNGEEIVFREVYKTASGKEGHYTGIKFSFIVVDGDNPESKFIAYWFGEGQDTGDKGVQKAGTSAEKYFLMKLFKVGDKDDPDAAKTDDIPAGTQSISATINRDTPPADDKSVDVPVDTVPANGQQKLSPTGQVVSVDEAQIKKNQIEALVWFGEQLPAKAGWFKGKIVPLVQLYDNKAKQGKLTDEEKESGDGVHHVFNQIAAAHHLNCGEDCEHINAAQIAVIMGGRITDPAK